MSNVMLYIRDLTKILYAVKPIFGWLQHLNMNAAQITNIIQKSKIFLGNYFKQSKTKKITNNQSYNKN